MNKRLALAALALSLLSTGARAQFFGDSPSSQQVASSVIAAQSTKASSVPSAGPGAGLCKSTIVPSNLVTSAGVTGTAGTCSTIIQCGTSASYVVQQFNVGNGC